MITGTVSERRAILNLTVRGPEGDEARVAFRLDTGFTGTITLPPDACTLLKLPLLSSRPAGAAGGTRLFLDVHQGVLIWDGTERRLEVMALGGAPLLGMAVLEGHEVRLPVVDGATVTVGPIATGNTE